MIKNTQKPEQRTLETSIDIVDYFRTIQGEGPFAGFPAVFIRMAGCNLKCPGCDTNYTHGRDTVSAIALTEELVPLLAKTPRAVIVITGGEPFRQPAALNELMLQLRQGPS